MDDMPKNTFFDSKILLKDGSVCKGIFNLMNFYNIVPNDKGMCHCSSKKKYKSCCSSKDVKGDFDEDNKIFYCTFDFYRSILIDYRNKFLNYKAKNVTSNDESNSKENSYNYSNKDNKESQTILKKEESNDFKNFIEIQAISMKENNKNNGNNGNNIVDNGSKKKYDKIYI